jgi:hypothetical protein
MKFSKLALVLGATLSMVGGLVVGTACSSSSGNGSGSGSGSGGTMDSGSGSDSATNEDSGNMETDSATGTDSGSTGTDAGCKNVKLHPGNAGGDIYCGYGTDGGSLSCGTGTECCVGGEIGTSGTYDPQICAPWNAGGTGCTNPEGGAIGVACNQVSDCTANGSTGAVACCLQGASLGAVAGCTYQHAKDGTAIICESSGSGDGGTGTCAAGELQVCTQQSDCATGTCTAVTWKLFQIGVCM